MEPFSDDENTRDDEPTGAASPDTGVVTGPAPYDAADDDDFEED